MVREDLGVPAHLADRVGRVAPDPLAPRELEDPAESRDGRMVEGRVDQAGQAVVDLVLRQNP